MKPAILRLIVFFCIFCIGHTALQAQTPHPDIAPLTALYNATNGPNWINKTNWLSDNNPCGWFGVSCDENGRVTAIGLSQNNLVGTIPTTLGNLSYLKWLDITTNQLSGSIPSQLGGLTNLLGLYLSNNQLNGSIPTQLGNLSQLQYLFLNNNQLNGNIPTQLGNLSNLGILYLSENSLTGKIPNQLGGLSNLYYLYLTTNQLNGSIPSQLGNLSNLRVLELAGNQLSGSIPFELGSLSNLTSLNLVNNQLSGSIPSQLGNLSNLLHLSLWNNQLSGNIPFGLGALKKLIQLDFSNNQLSGTIPSDLGDLSSLHLLNLDRNQLNSEIPAQLGNLSKLESLQISQNKLFGQIPTTLGNLNSLLALTLSNNQLSGQIPASLANIGSLGSVVLHNNLLSGCIPSSFWTLCGRSVNLSGNPNLPGSGSYDAWNAFCSSGAGSSFTAVASTATPTTCVGATVNLSVSGGTSHAWSGPNSFIASVQNPSFVANSQSFSGVYTVTANNGGGACSVTATVSVSVKVSPNITAQSNSPVCVGSSINLSTVTTDTKLKYQWSKDGGGFSSTVKNPVVSNASTASSGKYILVATGSNSCTISSSVSVSVIALPTVSIMPSGTVAVCGTPAVELTANASPGVSYKWYKSNVLITNANAFTYMVTQTGVYKAEVLVNGSSCKATSNSTTISSKPLPNAVASNTVSGTAITLSVTPNNMTYSWAGPNGFATTVQKPKISPPTTANSGVYTVTVTSSNGCSTSATTRVTISGATRLATENMNSDDEMELLVSPNPTQSKSIVAIQLKEASNIHLNLSDAMGRNLQTWHSAEPTQQMVVELDLSAFKSGMYLIVAETEKRRKTKKLMKQ